MPTKKKYPPNDVRSVESRIRSGAVDRSALQHQAKMAREDIKAGDANYPSVRRAADLLSGSKSTKGKVRKGKAGGKWFP